MFKLILFESRLFALFDVVKIKIMRYLEANIYAMKAKAIGQVISTIDMTSNLVTDMIVLYNIDGNLINVDMDLSS